ncbi:ROK family protein [uncultured Lacinutrix sp.]|uniref:ROK family protein n=1 Tax=uncultured Lacinutrix sp. TaxID=574032 RepID=UPI00260C27FA|nr:ROK family protein [uncultured Lacinutrix sp.]
MNIAIGIDIGGNHISALAINLDTKTVIENSFATNIINTKVDKDTIINKWVATINKTISTINKKDITGIGIATPGPFDYENGISLIKGLQKLDSLYNTNIKETLYNALNLPKSTSIRFVNDAFSFGIGEAWIGKAIFKNKAATFTFGTGFGSAFMKNGIPIVNSNSVPKDGFIYNTPFKGKIADEFISTRWFIKTYYEKTGNKIKGVKELADLAKDNTQVENIFKTFGKHFVEIILPYIKSFNPEVIVLGGNITSGKHLFLPTINEELKKHKIEIPVEVSYLKEKASILGACRLTDDDFYLSLKEKLYTRS